MLMKKRKFSGILCFRQQRSHRRRVLRRRRHSTIFVSTITFEGFKLRSSNLTHALVIQISQTSSIIYIAYRCEMDRNEIESDFRTSKMATGAIL